MLKQPSKTSWRSSGHLRAMTYNPRSVRRSHWRRLMLSTKTQTVGVLQLRIFVRHFIALSTSTKRLLIDIEVHKTGFQTSLYQRRQTFAQRHKSSLDNEERMQVMTLSGTTSKNEVDNLEATLKSLLESVTIGCNRQLSQSEFEVEKVGNAWSFFFTTL